MAARTTVRRDVAAHLAAQALGAAATVMIIVAALTTHGTI